MSHQNCLIICGISENTDWKQVIIEKESESFDLSATNSTFDIKGEIESNFFTTLSYIQLTSDSI